MHFSLLSCYQIALFLPPLSQAHFSMLSCFPSPPSLSYSLLTQPLFFVHYKVHQLRDLANNFFLSMTNNSITELTKQITPHANDEPLLKRSSSHSLLPHFCNDSACCLVCQQRMYCSYFQGKFQSQFTK